MKSTRIVSALVILFVVVMPLLAGCNLLMYGR